MDLIPEIDYSSFVNNTRKSYNVSDDLSDLLDLSLKIYIKDFASAKIMTKQFVQKSDLFVSLDNHLEKYKVKKPGLALFLSAICPGLGKVYNGAYAQGFSAFVSVASFASACAYFSYNNGIKDWKTWTFGAMGAGLWVVDVYGAFSGAKRFNKASYRNLKADMKGLFDEI
jgi:hypothetical protein